MDMAQALMNAGETRTGTGFDVHAFEEGSDIQAGTACYDGDGLAGEDLVRIAQRQLLVHRGVDLFGDGMGVDEIMRNGLQLGGIGLRGADGQLAVTLAGIGGNDLRSQLFGKTYSHGRFTYSGRPGEYYNRIFHMKTGIVWRERLDPMHWNPADAYDIYYRYWRINRYSPLHRRLLHRRPRCRFLRLLPRSRLQTCLRG